MMKPIVFSATSDAESSLRFYRDTLQLTFVEDSPFALVFDAAGVQLRIQKVDQVKPPPYTLMGFEVDDMDATVQRLVAEGATFERYEFMDQDEAGIWTAPGGARIAWFRDPDGNLLSLTQAPA